MVFGNKSSNRKESHVKHGDAGLTDCSMGDWCGGSIPSVPTMIRYATRLPPGKPVELLDNGNVRKTGTALNDIYMGLITTLLDKVIKEKPIHVVPVLAYKVLDSRHYQYEMQRCGLLTPSERELINTVGNLHDRHGILACEQDMFDLHFYSKQHPKLFEFLKMIVMDDKYWDIHSGNILMNEDREYCLIDLEGFIKAPIELHNDWIIE